MTEQVYDRPEGVPWKRAAELVGVDFPERTIELVVMPYESPIYVGWQGRTVRETIARGAFDGIQRRTHKIVVNVDHDERVPSTVGQAIALHPSRQEGLVAEVRIARTPLGDDVLALASEGDIGASAGFLPFPDGMDWQGRDAYRVTRAYLKHIAMTPDPAYQEAQVLAVRRAEPPTTVLVPTPNIDQILAWRRADELDRLQERYDSP